MKAGKRKSAGQPRFGVETLRELAGAKVFARGKDYFRNGHESGKT
jgi:hypothetical protein